MGRFHYWLDTGQVTILLPVLHRLPVLLSFVNYFKLVTYLLAN